MAQPVAGIVWDPLEPPPPGFYHPTAAASLWRPELGQQPAPRAHPQNMLPPLSSSLTVNVVHDTAKVSVTQLFQNSTSNAIRAGAYTFPLPAGCTVVEFSCRVGTNRIIRTKIGPKEVALQAFNDAVNRSQTASLLEQVTPEVFTTKLGNIPANERLKTEISFISVLKHRSADGYSTTTLIIPTHIAPRYGPPPTGLSHVQLTTSVDMGVGMNISVTWNEFTTTGAIPVANRAQVRLNELNFLDRDFVLDIITQPANGMEAPRAWLETHPLFEEHRALMLTVPPKFMLRNVAANHDAEIIFVADCSGSMRDKMQALKSAMGFFLRGVPSGRKFNIWCFGDTHTSLWPSSKDYSESNLHIALEYVSRRFISNMGGTELLSTLEAIVRARLDMLTADVIILTDGQIWRLDQTLEFVQHTRRSTEGRVRFFALGIGNAVSHELVEGIAKAGGGYAEVIPTAGEDGFDGRLLAMLSASLTGHIGPLRIEFEGDFGHEAYDQGGECREIDGGTILPTSFMRREATEGNQGTEQSNRPNFLQSPADISTLSPFLWNRVYMLFSPPVTLPRLLFIKIITSTPDGNEVVTRVAVRPLDANGSTLHKLGARSLLGDLERGQSWIQLGRDAPSLGEAALVCTEGEMLGCKWSLVSKWTSFYAVEEPYEEEGNIPDPLLDEDDAPIPQVVSDIGLLRSRGASGRQMHSETTAAPARAAALSDEGSDDDEEDDSQSDSWGTDHNDANGGDERRGEEGELVVAVTREVAIIGEVVVPTEVAVTREAAVPTEVAGDNTNKTLFHDRKLQCQMQAAREVVHLVEAATDSRKCRAS
ncbi:MAG: hypothetical protein M1839_004550 [Geoglossum umbratile]|nr:MAG: hypothetical protein M1839_004550 [Geoglossum umbratile]